MKPLKKYAVEGGVCVLEHAAIKNSSSLRSLIAGSELGIETALLEHYCFEIPNEFTHDLMTLVAAVRAADRQVRRIHSEGWSRLIHVDMPMFEAKRWREVGTRTALEDVLNFLTGDVWDFKFRQRRRKFFSTPQKCLSLTAGRKATFIPYSHGLDSYAQLRILQSAIQDVEAVCVFADTKQMSGGWKKFCMAMRKKSVKSYSNTTEV